MNVKTKEETLKINEKQRDFYNESGSGKNFISASWSFVRNKVLSDFRNQYGIKDRVYEEHKNWMGDLRNKKVLDLGCLRGNALSMYMAKNAGEYIGIDLSDKAIAKLQQKIEKHSCPNARAIAVDFYSPKFTERRFDIIYAYGVIHHFPDLEQLFGRMDEVLNPGGSIILYDPLQTSIPVRFARWLYRPFQNDKEWEWPFNKKALSQLDNHYHVAGLHGVLGRSKWAFMINPLPLPGKEKLILKMINDDWNIKKIGPELYRCMHVTMHLKKKVFPQ